MTLKADPTFKTAPMFKPNPTFSGVVHVQSLLTDDVGMELTDDFGSQLLSN